MTTPASGALCKPGDGRPFTVGPSRVEVKVEGAETDGRFSIIQWEFPPGAPAPPQHIHHDASETFYVLEGELEFPLGERVVKAGPGAAPHIPAGTAHTISNLELWWLGRLRSSAQVRSWDWSKRWDGSSPTVFRPIRRESRPRSRSSTVLWPLENSAQGT